MPEAAKQDILVNGTDLTYTYEWNQNTVSEKYRLKDSGDISEIQKDGKSIFYTYDAKRQLIRVDNQNTNMSCVYSYDDIGNIVKKESYQYDNGTQGKLIDSNSYNYSVNFPDRMTNFNGNEIQYDEMGNPTKYSDWLMKWEQGRKLTELTNLETTIQYKYDDINRIAKIVNGVETDFQYINNKISYQKDEVNTLEFQLNNKYEYIGFSLNEENYIYVKNLLGDIIAIEDFAGHTICTYEYDSWGNITQISGDQEVGELNPIRYREYYFDKETGFYNLGSRYYDPETARFINADELYLCIDNNENMYKYCENNPMYYIDDSGYYAMQNSHVIDQVKTTVYNYINSEKDNIPTDDKYLIATVAGEAVGENKTARRAVASAIVNRTVERFRSNGSFKSTISWSSQYSSYLSSEYNKCMKYLNSRNGKSTTYESLIGTCLKVGYRIISDITKGCKFFYSPQSMPGGKAPNWVIPSAEVKIDNIDRNHFRFYTKAK